MKSFVCRCGNTLFFDNVRCVACKLECGWCDDCQTVSSLIASDSGTRCGNSECQRLVRQCENRTKYEVCNAHFSSENEEITLCRSCRLTTDIPYLAQPENLENWRTLEASKRRLLYQLNTLGLPYDNGVEPPLSFRFLADTPDEHFATGHADGVITINLQEAKPVAREAARQQFLEPHRTLIGHFRHEVGHYYWLLLVPGDQYKAFVELFGDDQKPPYGDAMPAYYEAGPPDNWAENYISRYAAAHPWEDFAETSGFYLDMCAVLDTVAWQLPKQVKASPSYALPEMLADYRRLGIMLNEINRCMGLTDLLPEVVSQPVIDKLQYIHNLYRNVPKKRRGKGTNKK